MQKLKKLTHFSIDEGKTGIAYCHDGTSDGKTGPAGLFWLGGFMSDMQGSKAQLLARLAISVNRPCTRFDYSGHGASGGEFRDGTISKWLRQAITVFSDQTQGSRILVGSSMGGWLALLLYRYFYNNDRAIAKRIKGIVLIAPAVDMTKDLMWANYDKKTRSQISETGFYAEPSQYGDAPYVITRELIEDGKNHLILDQGIKVDCPIRILQGEKDPDVPWRHGLAAYEAIKGEDVIFSLVKAGDHRLSEPRNLSMLEQTCLSLLLLADRLDK